MDQVNFVQLVKKVVTEDTIKSVEELITNPPGRSPQKRLVDLSNWFKGLSEEDKERLRELIKDSANSAVFGFLCAIDGVRSIDNPGDKGRLLLYYEKNGDRVLLNDPDQDFLHDIYNSL